MGKIQKFMKENKNIRISIIIILVIILLGLLFSKGKSADMEKDNDENMTEDTSVVEEAVVGPKPYVVSNPKGAPVERLSYDDALVKYASSRIQFGESCGATPFYSVQKSGAMAMVDNRSKNAKIFTVGSTQYFVPAYDYTLVTLAYTNLPQTVYIDCGSQQNAATILVQE